MEAMHSVSVKVPSRHEQEGLKRNLRQIAVEGTKNSLLATEIWEERQKSGVKM